MLKPIRHQELKKLPEELYNLVIKTKRVPVVDQFFDIWNCESQIIILVGSYGSGKSFFAADMMINKCITDSYFRCYYGRKVYDTVRMSIFPTITEQIQAHELSGFKYSNSPTSSMVIAYKNGNKFSPFGADKIDKLKSIKEPSHFLLEELDQFTSDDFGMVVSRLGRTTKAKTQLVAMCNTDKIYPEHWLYDIIFGDNKIGAHIVWSNFRANTMLPDIEEYERLLRIRAMGDEDLFNSIANGAPGVRNRKSSWLYINYDHVIVDYEIKTIPGNTVYLSFDFNNEPMTCTAWQMSSGQHPMNGEGHFVRSVGEFEASMAETEEEIIQLLAKKVKAAFPFNPLRMTGDSNGRVRLKGVPGNKSIYLLLAKYLNIHASLIDVSPANLDHTISRSLCCTWLYNHKGIRISKKTTPKLVNDMRLAQASEKVPDELIKNRAEFKLDYFDTFRYIPATYFKYFIPDR